MGTTFTKRSYERSFKERAVKLRYYDYKAGIPGKREQKREEPERRIQVVYAAAKGCYGAPRIAAETKPTAIRCRRKRSPST